MNRTKTKSPQDTLTALEDAAANGDRGAMGALECVEHLARHPNPGGWADCQQVRHQYRDRAPDWAHPDADDVADAMRAADERDDQ